jgi:hypothetical protein
MPIADQNGFLIPSAAFPNQGHGDQFAVTTFRFWTRSFEQWGNLLPNIINNCESARAKIIKIVYHGSILRFGFVCTYIIPEDFIFSQRELAQHHTCVDLTNTTIVNDTHREDHQDNNEK